MSLMATLMCGRRFTLDDPDFLMLNECVNVMMRSTGPDNPADSLLFLRKLPFNPFRDLKKLSWTVKTLTTYMYRMIDEQTATFQPGVIRGFVDMMLTGNLKAGKTIYDRQTQCGLLLNLLVAGTATTVGT
jgi:cytochrome P450